LINSDDIARILELTEDFWTEHVKDKAFQDIASGKEIGHRIADYVDEKTTELLSTELKTGRQISSKGKVRTRSMGDVWVYSNDMYNPLNVKAGLWEENSGGQPNLVSLMRLLNFTLSDVIDSYYLLIVKMNITDDPAGGNKIIEPRVHLVDMLDYLDFVTFNSGPGQLMLKEKQFNEFMKSGKKIKQLNLRQKIERLIKLREDGDKQLFLDRQNSIDIIRKSAELYMSNYSHTINQEVLNFG
jgi:hypothetical protein